MVVSGLLRVVAAVLLLALAACGGTGSGPKAAGSTTATGGGGGGTEQATSSTSSTAGLTTEPASEPTTEASGTVEEPQQPADGHPAIQVAGLPIGGDAELTGADETGLCVHVNWILQRTSNTIPADLSVRLGEPTFTPEVYRSSPAGCSGAQVAPSCGDYVLTAERLRCDVSVALNRPAPDLEEFGGQGQMSMGGSIECPDYGEVTCRSFVRAVRTEPQVIDVPLPAIIPTGTFETPSTTTPPVQSSQPAPSEVPGTAPEAPPLETASPSTGG